MKITFDPVKNASNKIKHGVSFVLVKRWDWSNAIIKEDCRYDYPERRYLAFCVIDRQLYALVFAPRGNTIHVISLRKARLSEVNKIC
jgi:hypothetical protein